jgi:hypothetical protein
MRKVTTQTARVKIKETWRWRRGDKNSQIAKEDRCNKYP